MPDKMELKAYKKLAAIYRQMFSAVKYTAMTCVEYRKDKPDEVYNEMEHIADPSKWDYSGLLSKEDKAVLEMLEYLLDDNMTQMMKYNAWKPMEK